jgi:hypothetical protein
MKALEWVFKGLSAGFSAIPGLGILIGVLGAPPHQSKLFSAITTVFGVLTLAVILTNHDGIKKHQSPGIVACIVMIAIAFVGMLTYLGLLSFCVISSQVPEFADQPAVYFPLATTGDLAASIDKEGSRRAVEPP